MQSNIVKVFKAQATNCGVLKTHSIQIVEIYVNPICLGMGPTYLEETTWTSTYKRERAEKSVRKCC